jgi:hypothetical protein
MGSLVIDFPMGSDALETPLPINPLGQGGSSLVAICPGHCTCFADCPLSVSPQRPQRPRLFSLLEL